VEGGFCLLNALEVLDMPEVMRCVLLRMLEAVEGGLCSLEAQRCGGWVLFAGRVGGAGPAGGDKLRATLYARVGSVRWRCWTC